MMPTYSCSFSFSKLKLYQIQGQKQGLIGTRSHLTLMTNNYSYCKASSCGRVIQLVEFAHNSFAALTCSMPGVQVCLGAAAAVTCCFLCIQCRWECKLSESCIPSKFSSSLKKQYRHFTDGSVHP